MQAQSSNPSLTRRGLLRKGSAATVATLGVGASASKLDASPVGDARAIGPLGAVAAAGLAYLAYKGATKILGDTRDYSNYTGADALHQEIVVGATEMQSADERVMTSIQNNITNSQNVALAKGKAAVIEEMNAGNPESDAQTAMQNAIDEYYTTIQKNIYNHYSAQMSQIKHHWERVESHADLTADYEILSIYTQASGLDAWSASNDPKLPGNMFTRTSYNSIISLSDYTFNYLNGDSETYTIGLFDSDEMPFWFAVSVDHIEGAFAPYEYATAPDSSNALSAVVKENDGSGHVKYAQTHRYNNAWQAILDERDDVNSQLSGFVSDVYAQFSADEIPTEDLVDPITASTELDQNYDSYSTQAAHAAMMGIPTSAGNSLVLEVENPDDGSTALVEADLYTEHSPDGGFQTGNTYDPSTWSEPAYIAYRHTETNQDGEVVDETQAFEQLEMPFTIKEATDADGNSIDSFSPEQKVNQTSDVATLEEELAQIRDTQIEMQEEAQEPDEPSGGGGGSDDGFDWGQFSIAGVPGVAVVAIGGLLAYAGITTGS